MLKRNSKLLQKKLYHYLIPSTLMILAMQFGSLADGILTGNMISIEALTASSLVMPILYIIQMPGFAIGVGGSIVVGSYLGKRETEKASKAFSACLFWGVAVSVVLAALAPFISGPLASLYAPPELSELGRQYILIYLLTDPIITIALIISSFMSTDNSPKIASAFFIVSNVVKIASEVLFIKVFDMGMYGAALSTGAGYLVGLVTVIFYIRSDRRMLKFTMNLKGSGSLFKESLKASSSTAMNLFLTAVQLSVANIIIATIVTDPTEQAVFGVLSNFIFGFDLFVGGIHQLIPTICAVCYGEEDYYSLRSVARKLYLLTIGVTAVIMTVLLIDPSIYCKIFGADISGEGYFAIMRIYLISFIPYELNKFSQSYYPTVGKNMPAIITVVLREAVLIIPLSISLLYTMGLKGYALAVVLSETGTLLLTYLFILIYEKKKKLHKYGLYMAPAYDSYDSFDVSLESDIRQSAELSQELVSYSKAHGMNERDAQIVGLAGEEITDNIISFGYNKKRTNTIDVNLKIVNDRMVLRIRDDGVVFDPTKHETEDPDNLGGLALVKRLVNKITYIRVLNLNNTVLEINIQKEN